MVSKDYIDAEENFIMLMELHASKSFTRENLYLMCLDAESLGYFNGLFGRYDTNVRCVPASGVHNHTSIWKFRVKILACLVGVGHSVLLSDGDALWLGDPMDYMHWNDNVFDRSDILAQRGSFPAPLGER